MLNQEQKKELSWHINYINKNESSYKYFIQDKKTVLESLQAELADLEELESDFEETKYLESIAEEIEWVQNSMNEDDYLILGHGQERGNYFHYTLSGEELYEKIQANTLKDWFNKR